MRRVMPAIRWAYRLVTRALGKTSVSSSTRTCPGDRMASAYSISTSQGNPASDTSRGVDEERDESKCNTREDRHWQQCSAAVRSHRQRQVCGDGSRFGRPRGRGRLYRRRAHALALTAFSGCHRYRNSEYPGAHAPAGRYCRHRWPKRQAHSHTRYAIGNGATGYGILTQNPVLGDSVPAGVVARVAKSW